MINSSTPLKTDTRLVRWKRMLVYYQNLGSSAANHPKDTDTLRTTLVKLLRAINEF